MKHRKKKLLPALTRYMNIIFFKTYANIKSEIEKTYLGCLWWILEPMLQTAVFYVVITQFRAVPTKQFVPFLFVGTTIYNYFSNALNQGAAALILNAPLMQQVYLPKPVFVFITLTNLSWKFLFSLAILMPLVWLTGGTVTLSYLALPLLLLIQFLLAGGLALPLAAAMPYFQDGKTVLATLMNIGMWFSGVVYGPEHVSLRWRGVMCLNPITVLNDAYRRILLHGQWPDWWHLGYVFLAGGVAWSLGMAAMRRIDRRVTKRNV